LLSGSGAAREQLAMPQQVRALTNLNDATSDPAFSPNGNFVAFRRESVRGENSGIFVKDLSNDQLIRVTQSPDDCCPVWSADGRAIAFSRSMAQDFRIYVVPVNTTATASVNKGPTVKFISSLPVTGIGPERQLSMPGVAPRRGEIDWSPDGKTIAF